MISLVRPFTLNSTEPVLFALNLYNALIYGLHIWFEPFPIVFLQIYRFNLGEEGLAFLGILVGAPSRSRGSSGTCTGCKRSSSTGMATSNLRNASLLPSSALLLSPSVFAGSDGAHAQSMHSLLASS